MNVGLGISDFNWKLNNFDVFWQDFWTGIIYALFFLRIIGTVN